MKPFQRKQLLERIDREGATIGSEIPELITVDGEEFPLREFVFESKRHETVPAGEEEQVHEAKKRLRRERLQRRQRIESDDMTYEEGEQLAESILGIDRALNALESLEPTDLEAEASRQTAKDQKRWMAFLRKALGQDADSGRRRP